MSKKEKFGEYVSRDKENIPINLDIDNEDVEDEEAFGDLVLSGNGEESQVWNGDYEDTDTNANAEKDKVGKGRVSDDRTTPTTTGTETGTFDDTDTDTDIATALDKPTDAEKVQDKDKGNIIARKERISDPTSPTRTTVKIRDIDTDISKYREELTRDITPDNTPKRTSQAFNDDPFTTTIAIPTPPPLEIPYVHLHPLPTGHLYTINSHTTPFLHNFLPEARSHRALTSSITPNGSTHLSLTTSNRLLLLRRSNILTDALTDLVLVVHGVVLTRYGQDDKVVEIEGSVVDGVMLEVVLEEFDADLCPGGRTMSIVFAPVQGVWELGMGSGDKVGIRVDRHRMMVMLAEYIIQCGEMREAAGETNGGDDGEVELDFDGEIEVAEKDAMDEVFELISGYCMSRSTVGHVVYEFEDVAVKDVMQAALSACEHGAFWSNLVEVRRL